MSWRRIALSTGFSTFSPKLYRFRCSFRRDSIYWSLVIISIKYPFFYQVAIKTGRRLALEGRGLAAVATLAVMSGSIGVYVCSPFLGEGLVPLVVASGVLLGFGKGILFLRWGQAACSLDEESVECAVPLSFALACVTYFLLIAFKQPAFIVIDLILPLVSLGLLLSERRALSHPVSEARDASARSLLPLFAVLLLLWGQFSFLRIVSSPTTLTNRFFHYVIPFSCALVFAIGLFGAYIRHGRPIELLARFSFIGSLVGNELCLAVRQLHKCDGSSCCPRH